MRNTCVPHTVLPGTSALFADYLFRFERISKFYKHDPHDPGSIRRAALDAAIPDERRMKVAAALRKLNGDSAGVAELELPDSVAIVTGQQVGLFSGPAYTIYKALTAVRLARHLTQNGIRAVPVFWLATEDHDFAEIDHAWVFGADQAPRRLQAEGDWQPGQMVGGVKIVKAPVDGLRAALDGMMHADEVLTLVEESYRPGRTFGKAFRLLLRNLFSGYGMVFLDPTDPEIREIAAPLLGSALEQSEAIAADLMERGRELAAGGYHSQVLFEQDSSLFFELDGSRRLPMRRNGAEYLRDAQVVPRSRLMDDPARLSPNALLRPVMQDYLLPTAAYVGGPAEIAYLAQSEVIYQRLLGRMPVAVPRSGFTLLDERAHEVMDYYNIALTDCFHGEQVLRERIAARLIPESLEIAFDNAASEVRTSIDRLHGELHSFDPTLGDALLKSREKILYQVEKNKRKAAREALRREERVSSGARYLSQLVFPERHLQERLYCSVPFLARHGLELLDTLYSSVAGGCPDHLLLTV
jgi:bacillithiol synthase